jgi:A/G-specific adenine glycosylase
MLSWFSENARDLPWRRTRDPYAVWVSEIMLQQTQVKAVLGYWERWMKALPDIRSLANARSQTIHKLWEGLGYYHRVRNMQKAAGIIIAQHGGRFPRDFEAVLNLPGIGRYTAGAICSIVFGQQAPILDGNVIRVLTRLFGIPGDPRDKETNESLWKIAQQLVEIAAPDACSELNQSLMELGALICAPLNPRCSECPVSMHCVALRQGKTRQLPETAARPRPTRRQFVAFVARKNDSLFVRQRPPDVVNGWLWEFPNIEMFSGDHDLQKAAVAALGAGKVHLKELCTIRHSITRYAITLKVFTVAENGAHFAASGQWLRRDKLARVPFCSAHKKILESLQIDF